MEQAKIDSDFVYAKIAKTYNTWTKVSNSPF